VIGNVVNKYEIRALIGYGGVGTVYLAEHPTRGYTAAIKVLRRAFVADEALVADFLDEALAANDLEHPNIVAVMAVGRLGDGLPYIMTELLDGETLGQRLRRQKRLTVRQMIRIVEQTAAALGAAHARGVVHGDLKPENLFLARAPMNGERVKVMDFGIARLRGDRERQIDGRSDIQALGKLMYQMLCGRVPFPAARGSEQVMVSQLLEPPRSLNPDIPPEIEAVILRALAGDPANRFATMAELVAALHEADRGVALAPVLRLFPAAMPLSPANDTPPLAPTTLFRRQGGRWWMVRSPQS